MICKELGYKRHIVEFGIMADVYYSTKITKYIRNGVLSNLFCPDAAKSFDDCTFAVGKVYQSSCVALACEPKPGKLHYLTYYFLISKFKKFRNRYLISFLSLHRSMFALCACLRDSQCIRDAGIALPHSDVASFLVIELCVWANGHFPDSQALIGAY